MQGELDQGSDEMNDRSVEQALRNARDVREFAPKSDDEDMRGGLDSAIAVPMPDIAATVIAGLVSGLAGTAVMTMAEKLEQTFTGRPNSYVPAHTLERLTGIEERPPEERWVQNQLMHWGQGALLGVARAFMARAGISGPFATFIFSAVRLTADQTLENATGVGYPPWTYPRGEQALDIAHKVIYAFATGLVADRLVGTDYARI